MDSPAPNQRPYDLPDLLTSTKKVTAGGGNHLAQKKHVVDLFLEFGGIERVSLILSQIVADELMKIGVEYETTSTRSSRSKSRKSPRPHKDLSLGVHRLVEAQLTSSETKVHVPFIIKETCDFIRNHIADEGILRKSGSSSRSACIMQRFINQDTDQYFSTFDTVHDVANVLKQYLREMDTPLIPHSVHNVFIRCMKIKEETARTENILIATCLLPRNSVEILSYVMEFLAEVASCDENLMTRENLAIVMGPNVMPVDTRKHERGKDFQCPERQLLDLHNKVVEALIANAKNIGRVNSEVEKRLETYISLRSSEDELENDGVGRRKKRRSGSLNRMLGYLKKKVTSGKGTETPVLFPSTPGDDSFNYTPVINGSTRKQLRDENNTKSSIPKKKNLLDGVRKNGFHLRVNSDAAATPKSLAGRNAFQSPAICLDPHPSPMKLDWKQTPSGNRLKNFVTPSLLRRRKRSGEADKNAFSAPAKSTKSSKLRFGNKTDKKQMDSDQALNIQQEKTSSSSTLSIHKLAKSPRAMLLRNSSSQLSRPAESVGNLLEVDVTDADSICRNKSDGTDNIDGEYVTISATADLNDIKNQAFIASSLSLTDSECDVSSQKRNEFTPESGLSTTFLSESSICEPPTLWQFRQHLKLTPLISEIDTLTRTAQDMSLSTSKPMASLPRACSQTLPEPMESDVTPVTAEQVESKFIETMKETKIMKIRNENIGISRRMSVQERGISPSQRRIFSAARRRSHEIGRVTPSIPSPRFISMRSPRARPQTTLNTSNTSSTLKRSPTRCTLRRGRPNTTRVGLARPSPVRNTPRSGLNRSSFEQNKSADGDKSDNTNPTASTTVTPLRRMSSVQELVLKLEEKRKLIKATQESQSHAANDKPSTSTTTVPHSEPIKLVKKDIKNSTEATHHNEPPNLMKKLPPKSDRKKSITDDEIVWMAAHNFAFERKDLRSLRSNSDRDSIQFLKTLHAGKVPATVEYFNKIGKPTKSPGRSLIPRYTALHRSDSSKISLYDLNTHNPDGNGEKSTLQQENPPTDRMSRRLSAVDIRQKNERLLDTIKRETKVKRSATTAGTLSKKSPYDRAGRPKYPEIGSRRPTTLEIKVSPAPTSHMLLRSSSRRLRTPTAKTPTIAEEEDEALTKTFQKAIDTLLRPNTAGVQAKVDSGLRKPSPRNKSPLKMSNAANVDVLEKRPVENAFLKKSVDRTGKEIVVDEKFLKMISSTERYPGGGPMTRTISERGTKATSVTPRTTPKIRKALTTRPYDLVSNTPAPGTHAHNCPTITPRRRVARPLNGELKSHTPLKATHSITPNIINR